jgi:hypothetical protein
MPSRKNNYRVYATIDGRDLGLFETWSGGDGDSEETTYTEGNGSRIPLGGMQTRDGLTIGRRFDSARDLPIKDWLDNTRGRKDGVFTKQYVDDEENPVGKPITRRVKIKKVTDPEADKNSSDVSTFEIETTPYV